MKLSNIKRTIVTSTLSLATLLGTGIIAHAQWRDRDDKTPSQVQRVELERQHQYEEQVRLEQQRQSQLRTQYERNRRPWEMSVKYKVYQNNKMFITDARGLEMLKQAVIKGYEEGFKAGMIDRRSRRNVIFMNSSVYKNGSFGYQKSVDLKQYQFFFQKGFAEGYQDGFNTRRFRGWYQNDGNLSERELRAILKYERF
jgi:hypothetical protein